MLPRRGAKNSTQSDIEMAGSSSGKADHCGRDTHTKY
jgi:hypothetical protein